LCPGAFGWFPVGKVAGLFTKLRIKKSVALINLFFLIIILSILGILALPLYWINELGVFYSIGYVLTILIHFFFFVLTICAKCAGRRVCPTAKLSNVLNKKIYNRDIFE